MDEFGAPIVYVPPTTVFEQEEQEEHVASECNGNHDVLLPDF